MNADCKEKLNPLRLKRDGAHQGQRLTAALDPAFVRVDEREPANWMVFARRYARYLHYFDSNNLPAGDWQAFFSSDPAAYLATAAIQNVDFYKIKMQEYLGFLLDLENDLDAPGLKKNFGNLFNCAGTLAWQLEQLKKALPETIELQVAEGSGSSYAQKSKELALRATLQNTIASQLAPAFARLIKYYNAAITSPIDGVDLTAQLDWEILGADILPFSTILGSRFSNDWVTDSSPDWAAFLATLTADASIYGDPLPPTPFERLNHAAAHNLFTDVLDHFLKAYSRIVADAKRNLEAMLSGWDRHEPHYTLFLAFLRLLVFARDHANTLTGRHLDFYYKQVLQLKETPAQPNEAHLLVELAKHVDSHLLNAGTVFKAGKDSLGKDVFYALAENFVANKAQVAELKSIFHYHRQSNDSIASGENGRLFASPIANSADGAGAELTTPDGQWHPFAQKTYQKEKLAEIKMPKATVGFAVASHYLLMREGERRVFLFFKLEQWLLPKGDYSLHFQVEITGEKGWIIAETQVFGTQNNPSLPQISQTLQFNISLPGNLPSTAPYSQKIHGGNFDTDMPMVRVFLRHTDQPFFYEDMASLVVRKVHIVTLSNGLKDLAISNDFGDLDASKPFQPFGPQPIAGASLTIGCKELFQKQAFSMNGTFVMPVLTIKWKAQPSLGNIAYVSNTNNITTPPTASLQFLKNGVFSGSGATNSFKLFENASGATSSNLDGYPSYLTEEPDFSEKEYYGVNSKSGFFRLRLNTDFGHNKHLEDLVDYLAKKANPNAAISDGAVKPPFAPYTPVIEEITLSFMARQDINLDASANFQQRNAHFFHLHPFGFTEAHAALDENRQLPHLLPRYLEALQPKVDEPCVPGGKPAPLPTETMPAQHEAEFYIGIVDLKPPQNLSILFQLAEGSANPKTLKPADHVRWSFLSNNQWVAFRRDELNDRTDQLLRSGIITFSMPRGATSDNTLLPAGFHWLRASIARRFDENGLELPSTTDAVCKIIQVAAQAARVVFQNKGNAPDFLRSQLPAKSVAKLVVPQSEVKKVEQPFPSFGGRAKEESSHFYTRVSERLRHKNRSITAWDYERMVLEAFPHIYKVKCLNHTWFQPKESGVPKYHELAPGHVTLIAIPNLQNHNAIDPLRPYTSLGDLNAVADFLKKHVSCHVDLHVHNPAFEEVEVDFCVKFHPGIDEAFHLKLLDREIVRFLSPWAFGEGKDINFGGRAHKSSLINFVEERPYVDFITDFKMYHLITDANEKDWSKVDQEEIEATKAISILVSAEKHTIKAIPAKVTDLAPEKCNC